VKAGHRSGPLNLIFDADDTLWDSNVHFLEAFESFALAIEEIGLAVDRTEIRSAVRDAELKRIEEFGYGRAPYVAALHHAAARLAQPEHRVRLRKAVAKIGTHLIERDCPLLPGVRPALEELALRHRLLLFTKGQPAEQLRRLARSGLGRFFERIDTPREKDVSAYRRLVREAELDPGATFMIGNSPRSDINPAVRAGLRAVFIPHPHTWELEQEEIQPADGMIIEVNSFHRLLEVF